MRVAISNIAWDVADDKAVAELLRKHGVDAIDVAPTKYFANIAEVNDGEVAAVRRWWSDRGVEITGMQSLLFGTQGLNLFGDPAVRETMLNHLTAVCRIGRGLGATRLVFGSPRNRDRTGVDDRTVRDVASDFFKRLGERAATFGVTICLEPNPARYGANFMLDSVETASIVREIDHPSIAMQLDTGAMTINGEDAAAMTRTYADLIGHVHASEPDLVTLGDGTTPHAEIAGAMREVLPTHVVSIEMLPSKTEPNLSAIDRALAIAVRTYREGT